MPTADDILEQLVNPEMLRQLRAQQAQAAAVNTVPPPPNQQNTVPAPAAGNITPPPPLPTITQPLPSYAGVMPGTPPSLPPRMTGDQFVQQAGGPQIPLPSGSTFSTGPNSPTLLPTTGSERVEVDPEWRRRWDAAQASDAANPVIAALGGPKYGAPGAIPTFAQASQRIPGLTPTEYAHILGVAGQNLIGTGQLGVSAQNAQTALLQAQKEPSIAQQNQQAALRAQALPLITQLRTQNPNWTINQIYGEAARQLHTDIGTVLNVMGSAPTPASGAPPLPGSIPHAPAGIQTVATVPLPGGPQSQTLPQLGPPAANDFNAPSNSGGGQTRAWQPIEQQLNQALNFSPANGQLPASGVDKNGKPIVSIGEFINRLETQQPGLLANAWPAIRGFLVDKFGERPVMDAEKLTSELGPTGQLRRGMEMMGERLHGTTDENLGLSVLRNLRAAQMQQNQGPTPGSPPLPQ